MMERLSADQKLMISSVLDRPDMLFACLFYRESPWNRIVSAQGVLTSRAAMDDFPGK